MLLRRTAHALALVAVSVSLGFLVLHVIPGDPFGMVTGQAGRGAEALARLRAQNGLNGSLLAQYLHFAARILTGSFGTSLTDGQPVATTVRTALFNSLSLGLASLVFAVLIGTSIGSLQGWRPRSVAGRILGTALNSLYAAPQFIVAIVLVTVLAYKWTVFPVGGIMDPVLSVAGSGREQLRNALWHLTLPALTLGLGWGAAVARQQRVALTSIADAQHVQSARAKGVRERQVFAQHAFRPSLRPVVVTIGLMLPEFISGAVVVETVFSWPGVGSLLLKSIGARDYPLVSAGIVAVGVAVSLACLLSDVVIASIDPRARAEAA